jgi:hypothetical protein
MTALDQHWRRLYESKYLGAWDLFDSRTGRYREITARIDRVSDDEVVGEGGRKSKPIQLHLSGRKGPVRTPMIVSKTSGKTLEVMFGPTPAQWVGQEITVYVRASKRVQQGTGAVLTIRNTRSSDRLREDILEAQLPAIDEADLNDGGDNAETH